MIALLRYKIAPPKKWLNDVYVLPEIIEYLDGGHFVFSMLHFDFKSIKPFLQVEARTLDPLIVSEVVLMSLNPF